MNDLRLRFCDGDQPDLVLGAGVHALGRLPTGLGPVETSQPWLLQLCNDKRGIWLTVADDLRGVHVNGRPVQNVAMLRAGDSIHVDGGELLLTAANDASSGVAAASAPRDAVSSLRVVLRGIGGPHHGRSIALDKPRSFGRASSADIRIEGPAIAERHAVVESVNGQVILRDAQADVRVNGHPTRHAALQAGDQVAFDVQHRFIVEGPPPHIATAASRAPASMENGDDAADAPRGRTMPRVPWLLIAALLLAAALSSLLLFGAR